jgi:hypothetical protein
MQVIGWELKYCERCGSLRLRRADSAETYCRPCGRALFSLPLGEALRSKRPIHRPRAAEPGPPVLHPAGRLELAHRRAL